MALAYPFWSGWWLKYPSMDEYPKMRRMSLEITILWSLPSFWRTTDRIRVFWRWGDCVKRGHVSILLLWKVKKRIVTNLKTLDPPPFFLPIHPTGAATPPSCNPPTYRKIPKISPGAYFFQRPFLRGLFLEGLIFVGAYLRRAICVSKSIGLALKLEVNLKFLLCFTLYLRAIFQVQAPGGLYLEGRFNGGFFALRFWGAYNFIWRGLYMEGLIFGILRYP